MTATPIAACSAKSTFSTLAAARPPDRAQPRPVARAELLDDAVRRCRRCHRTPRRGRRARRAGEHRRAIPRPGPRCRKTTAGRSSSPQKADLVRSARPYASSAWNTSSVEHPLADGQRELRDGEDAERTWRTSRAKPLTESGKAQASWADVVRYVARSLNVAANSTASRQRGAAAAARSGRRPRRRTSRRSPWRSTLAPSVVMPAVREEQRLEREDDGADRGRRPRVRRGLLRARCRWDASSCRSPRGS